MNIYSKYIKEIFGDNIKHLQVVYTTGKIKFEVYDEDKKEMAKCKDPAFYSCYLCYKLNIPNEGLYL